MFNADSYNIGKLICVPVRSVAQSWQFLQMLKSENPYLNPFVKLSQILWSLSILLTLRCYWRYVITFEGLNFVCILTPMSRFSAILFVIGLFWMNVETLQKIDRYYDAENLQQLFQKISVTYVVLDWGRGGICKCYFYAIVYLC